MTFSARHDARFCRNTDAMVARMPGDVAMGNSKAMKQAY
jgi:hypothetical protein